MDDNGNPVVNPDGTFQQDPDAVPVNQAPIKVGNVTVNEGSPYAIFKLKGGGTDQTFTLGNLLNDSNTATANATLGTDAATNTSGTNLEYYDPVTAEWVPYVAGTSLTLTANTDFLVRTKVNYDTPVAEGPETFQLQVNASGFPNPFYGTATIVDDGTGALFGEDNTTGTPDAPRASLGRSTAARRNCRTVRSIIPAPPSKAASCAGAGWSWHGSTTRSRPISFRCRGRGASA